MHETSKLPTFIHLRLAFLFALLLLLGWPGIHLDADCNQYWDSKPVYYNGQLYCGYNGGGCTECTDDDGNHCATDGSACTPRHQYAF